MKKMFFIYLVYCALPWITIGEYHVILLNILHQRLEFIGVSVEVNTAMLIAVAVILFSTLFLVFILTLSSSYCGKYCPTTWISRVYGRSLKGDKVVQGGYAVFVFIAWGLLFLSTLFYMVSPYDYGVIVGRNFSHPLVMIVVGLSFLFTMFTIFSKGWYCTYLCPYKATTLMVKPKPFYVSVAIIFVGILLMMVSISQERLHSCQLENKGLYTTK